MIEFAPKETEINCDWYTAVMYCFTLGPGWRLPTIDELTKIKESKCKWANDDSNTNWYWSSTETSDYSSVDSVKTFNPKYGMKGICEKTVTIDTVRAVRDL